MLKGVIKVQIFVRCFPFKYCYICKNSGYDPDKCNFTVTKMKKNDNFVDCEYCCSKHTRDTHPAKPYCTKCKEEHINNIEKCKYVQELLKTHTERLRKKLNEAKFKSKNINKSKNNPSNTLVIEQSQEKNERYPNSVQNETNSK